MPRYQDRSDLPPTPVTNNKHPVKAPHDLLNYSNHQKPQQTSIYLRRKEKEVAPYWCSTTPNGKNEEHMQKQRSMSQHRAR